MGKMQIKWESKHRTSVGYTHAWPLLVCMFGGSSHPCLQLQSEKKFDCWRDRNDLEKGRAWCVTACCSRDI